MSIELSEPLKKALDSLVFGVVATVGPDGRPHQSVVWVRREGSDVLFTILRGSRKERNILHDARVSVLLHPADAPYTYAAIRGTAHFMDVPDPVAFFDEFSMKYRGMPYRESFPVPPHESAIVAVRVVPETVFEQW
ncbi:PPOX class F420-dependent oxidoreductase [Streptomyces sp. NPDC051162]|uniref:PPOX class F420-dependent oxidoreductase n=1 Tax=unclassified Streptomyces TaxID=2593676 RepID=UPI003423933F